MNPSISVIIPLYNSEKFIGTAVESVLSQTFTDFELIIIDDCSTDNSLEVVQKFNDPRIKIYRQLKNSGESSSRNLGLINSSGKYVYFMDHDDALLPDCLEIFYKAAEETQADVVHMNSALILEGSFENCKREILSKLTLGFLKSDAEYRLTQDLFQGHVYMTPWIKFSRRDFLIDSQLYFPPTKLMADVLHLIGELCFAKKIYTIDEIGYVWRQHTNQTSRESIKSHMTKALESIPVAIKFLNEIFASSKLISAVSSKIQFETEYDIIRNYFISYIQPAYKNESSKDEINQIINDVINKHVDLNFFRDLINFFAMEVRK